MASNLVLTGAFRLPSWQSNENSFDYAGPTSGEVTGFAYWRAHQTLLVSAFHVGGKTAEVSIPVPKTGSLTGLNRASLVQSYTDILDGKRLTVNGGSGSGAYIGGYLPTATGIVVTVYDYYDAGPPASQTLTHFRTVQNFSAVAGQVVGPVQVDPTYPAMGGFVSGWMLDIPVAYQAALGGKAFTGNGALSINARCSWGPALTVFNPEDVGVLNPVPGTRVLGYNGAHPTIGHYDSPPGPLYNGAAKYGGAAFPEGTSTVLVFGRVPTTPSSYCYGVATSDPSLAWQPVPGYPTVHYCYDPTGSSGDKGTTGYPYTSIVLAYDVNDLIAVKQGQKSWWEPIPYATWPLTLPYDYDPVWNRNACKYIQGVAYDPDHQRIFLLAGFQDHAAPIVHVFQVVP